MPRNLVRGVVVAAIAVVVVAGVVLVVRSPTASVPEPCGAGCPALVTSAQELVARDGGPPGVIVLVDRMGTVTVHSVGTSDVGAATPITTGDTLRLASVSKAYSGAVALSLVAAGALHLTDTVGQWVPGMPPAWDPVTLAELLQHTSGIPDFSQAPAFGPAVQASLLVPPSHVGLLQFAFGMPMTFTPPGTGYAYSNSDNVLVALMVDAASHRTYEDELAQRVLGPLGLRSTSLPAGADLPAPFAHGYTVAAGTAPDDVTSLFAAGWSWSSGGVVATPADLDRFVRAYVRGATTSTAVRAEQFRFRPGSSEPEGPGSNAAGLGIFRYRTRCGTVYGHTGNTSGYTQFAAASADGSRSVVVSVNAQITPRTPGAASAQLRHVETLAVCATLAH